MILQFDAKGAEYACMAFNEAEKTKQGTEKEMNEKTARMYGQPGSRDCPVASLRRLLKKLNPENMALFQYPNPRVNVTNSKIYSTWYQNKPLGKNTLDTLMKKISQAVPLSQIYTNHCIRATSITLLARAGVDSTSITSLTGHKSTDSLKPYLRGPTEAQRHAMSSILHGAGPLSSSSSPAIAFPRNPPPTTASHTYVPEVEDVPSEMEVALPEPASQALATTTPTGVINIQTASHHQLASIFTGTTFNGPVNISFYNHNNQ